MRLIAYAESSTSFMAVEVSPGALVSVGPLEDFYADTHAGIEAAAALLDQPPSARRPLAEVRQVPPVPATARVLCAGLNYRRHATEMGRELPDHPDLFARWASTLVVDGETVPVPVGEGRLDSEVELAVVIGAPLSGASPEEAEAALLGYTCLNDLSARGYQMATSQWALGKNADRSGPIGPAVVTPDELTGWPELAIGSRVNGQVMQAASTADLIFSPAQIASYASGCMTLRPGDVISTGTPDGVGSSRTPPVFLHPGDTVEVEIEGIGVLRNVIGQALDSLNPMATRITHGPRPFTYEDLEEMPDDGYRREIIGGSLIVTPAPNAGHQRIAARLTAALLAAERPDTVVLVAPCDWHLPSGDNLEPDLLVIDRSDFDPAGPVPSSATPLLVAEILSACNANQDRMVKRALYESLGVPAYWIVDPWVPSVLSLRLDGGHYQVEAEVAGGEVFVTEWPFTVRLVPAELRQ